MPKRTDIQKVLIVGSGPIVIGQACEFDYSGTQACKALRSLGYQIVLVNSNPATIMTDPGMADATYIEPLTWDTVADIIAQERPDALLPNLGGQTGLNIASELHRRGILSEYGVQVIGVNVDAIERGEDRIVFKNTMQRIGIEVPRSDPAYSVEEAERVAASIGYPVVIRPAYCLGGTGGGLVYNVEELRTVASRGLAASLIKQVLVEESVAGWEELELEVVRDSKGQKITVCFIENVDAMGVHTGDSFCTAPMLTISENLQQRLQELSYRIVDSIQVIGGTNVQFAHDPKTDHVVVIEINPRTSRSSALASKATGFPIAYVSALLAAGIALDEIPYWREGTLEKYTPCGDYVVVKFARWAFEKFPKAIDKLGTQMRAVGEVMAIGKTYKEAFQKAIRSLENNRYGLGFARDYHKRSMPELMELLNDPTSERQFIMYEALRKGAAVEDLYRKTHIKPWFIQQMKELVELEERILTYRGRELPDELLVQAKKDGFSDRYLASLLGVKEEAIRSQRERIGLTESFDRVPVSGVKDAAYYYSSYHVSQKPSPSVGKKKVMVLGGGPNRIGQGIEFDYCCVHAAFAARDMGYATIMVNCNPETVSTDYDTADLLYFDPLTVEDVLSMYRREQPEGVIVQFGGQTPLNIAAELEAAGVKILGHSPATIALAEDRDLFRKMMEKLGIPMPVSAMASNLEEALAAAEKIGYPVMLRPSFVLGGRGMEVIHDSEMLSSYLSGAVGATPDRPVLIDKFLEDALEVEVDAICDGREVFVPAIMEHIEFAGIHSGDSACIIPPLTISERHRVTLEDYTRRIALELGVVGAINIQYAIAQDTVYVLEANPRASRTVPLVSKVYGVPLARLATQIMLGKKISELGLQRRRINHFGVKQAVFPFVMFPEVDPVLGPEMRSTGEVLGLADCFGMAFYKAQLAAGQLLPLSGTVLMSVAEQDRKHLEPTARGFHRLGFKIKATQGTHAYLKALGIPSELVLKLQDGRPNIVDCVTNGEVQLIINTPVGRRGKYDDSYIRKAAVKYKVPYIVTLTAALAAVRGIEARLQGQGTVKCLQAYIRELDKVGAESPV